jgi:hypothetical protein
MSLDTLRIHDPFERKATLDEFGGSVFSLQDFLMQVASSSSAQTSRARGLGIACAFTLGC